MASLASSIASDIRNSGLSRQAWFEAPIESPIFQEGDSVWFVTKYGYQGMGHIYAILHDSEEVVVVNYDGAFTLNTQGEWDALVMIEKAESQAMFAHISLVDQIKNLFAAIVA